MLVRQIAFAGDGVGLAGYFHGRAHNGGRASQQGGSKSTKRSRTARRTSNGLGVKGIALDWCWRTSRKLTEQSPQQVDHHHTSISRDASEGVLVVACRFPGAKPYWLVWGVRTHAVPIIS